MGPHSSGGRWGEAQRGQDKGSSLQCQTGSGVVQRAVARGKGAQMAASAAALAVLAFAALTLAPFCRVASAQTARAPAPSPQNPGTQGTSPRPAVPPTYTKQNPAAPVAGTQSPASTTFDAPGATAPNPILPSAAVANGAVSQPRAAPRTDILTLDQALAIALKANRKLDDANLEVQKATAGLNAAKTNLLPSLKLGATEAYNLSPQAFTFPQGVFGNNGPGPIPSVETQINSQSQFTTGLSLDVSQPLLQLYRLNLIVDQHGIQQSLAQQGVRAERQELVKQVRQQYFELLKTQSSLGATEESIAFYRELAQLTERYVKEKVALQYQSLEANARLARAEHKARTERNALETQSARFNELLGRDVKTRFQVAEVPGLEALRVSQSDAEASALAQRPEVQAAKLKLQQAQTGYKIVKSEYLPDLNLTMRYSRLFNTEFIPPEVWTVGLELRWEFYDWGKKSQDLHKKSAAIAQARNGVEDAQAQIVIEVDARRRELEEARSYLQVTEMTQAAAREKVRVLLNQYRQKAVLLKDLLQAESELADANNEHEQALLSLWTADAQLRKAMGTE